MSTSPVSFLSVRNAHLAAAHDRAMIALVASPNRHSTPSFDHQMAADVLWLLKEIRRLDELVITCGLAIDHGEP